MKSHTHTHTRKHENTQIFTHATILTPPPVLPQAAISEECFALKSFNISLFVHVSRTRTATTHLQMGVRGSQ